MVFICFDRLRVGAPYLDGHVESAQTWIRLLHWLCDQRQESTSTREVARGIGKVTVKASRHSHAAGRAKEGGGRLRSTQRVREQKKKKKKVSTDNKSLFWPPYISGIRLSKVRQSVVKAQSPENDFAGGHRPSGVSPAEGLAGPSSSLLSYFRVVLKGRITHACLSWYCPVYVVR